MAIHLPFYGLEEDPFTPAPDPRFLYLTPAHREALAQLTYGVQHRKGFVLLTGEVGTGKTTLLHALLQGLEGTTAVAFVTNSLLPFDGILEYALEDLGIGKPRDSQAQRLFALQDFLIERRRAGQDTVLVLDEAQNLSPEVLEQVRLLSNFETSSEKVLQIVLAGQPELEDKLAEPALRQLRQRIGLRCRIRPLSREETRDYIRTRLQIAGAQDTALFTGQAVERIHWYTCGVPRLINTLCDHCLVSGYADQVRRIDRPIVEEAIDALEGPDHRRARRAGAPGRGRWPVPRLGLLGGGAAGALAAGLVLGVLRPDLVRPPLEWAALRVGELARSLGALFGP